MSRRTRGMTLIEVMLMLIIGSILAGIAVTLMVGLLRTERVGRQHGQETRALDRLSRQFRADVHASRQCNLSPDAGEASDERPLCDLTCLDGTRIEYGQKGQDIVRRENRPSEPTRHETFQLPPELTARVSRGDYLDRELVELTLDERDELRSAGRRSPRREWRVRAEPARNARLAQLSAATTSAEETP